mmetsp:Transcript_3425/g.8044  ORF Transcript_3425/g.8044 Transcript_3425/m.8044 type:complete len:219 (+) Transcript_3425:903-1559(+)
MPVLLQLVCEQLEVCPKQVGDLFGVELLSLRGGRRELDRCYQGLEHLRDTSRAIRSSVAIENRSVANRLARSARDRPEHVGVLEAWPPPLHAALGREGESGLEPPRAPRRQVREDPLEGVRLRERPLEGQLQLLQVPQQRRILSLFPPPGLFEGRQGLPFVPELVRGHLFGRLLGFHIPRVGEFMECLGLSIDVSQRDLFGRVLRLDELPSGHQLRIV